MPDDLQIVMKAQDILKKSDFEASFRKVLELLIAMEKRNSEAIANMQKVHAEMFDKMNNAHSENYKTLKGQVNDVFVGDQVNRMKIEHSERMASVKDGNDGQTPTTDELISLIKPLIPPAIKGDKGIVEDITDIREDIKELKEDMKKQKSRIFVGAASGRGGHIVKVYSLSSQLNGVLKTFSLPAFWRVLNVHSASFPYSAFEPTVDYSVNGSAMTLTFTDKIDAASTLVAGQTLLIEYAEI